MRWRGSFQTALRDVRDNAIQIVSDLLGRNAKGFDALLPDPFVTPLIASGIVSEIVRETVNFDSDAGGFAEEVEHKRPKGMLSAELQPLWPQLQDPPESYF